MMGHMVRAGANSFRYFMVAKADSKEAEESVRRIVGQGEPLASQPLAEQVFAFMGMTTGQVQEWRVGDPP